jgi:hypothetical protein
MIKFAQHAFAYETGPAYNSATHHSTAGAILGIVGHVSYFCAPMAALNPNDPTKEYTFYITGVSGGTAHIPVGPTTFHETDYSGVTFEIHEGSPENAPLDGTMPPLPDATVPATFIDGPVVLSGTIADFHVSISTQGSNINGSFLGHYQATGGSYYPLVGDGVAVFQGNWCDTQKPTGCTPATYSAHPDGKWDTPGTTATMKSTWGAVKQLYR